VTGVVRLDRIRLVCREPDRLAAFYVQALGFRDLGGEATARRLQFGDSRLELAESPDGQPYPELVPGWDLRFQHFALAVPDMATAFDRLGRTSGWCAISTDGPQQLPAASGGAVAFKFRDPEGHPLELLHLPMDPLQGVARIDHSAISISETFESLTFYQTLGLRFTGGSMNRGPEQDRLDGVHNAIVEVSALETEARAPPHVELLCYRRGPRQRGPGAGLDDVAATHLIFTVATGEDLNRLAREFSPRVVARPRRGAVLLRDPDGHLLEFEAALSPGG
jgi:catechol 2,3-dioxygenase-like lactoylglutathione lyase family enzyme